MKLEKGDTIGVIALAGDCEKERIDNAVINLRNLGYKVKLSNNIYKLDKYLAGSDNEKVAELHSFFEDSDIKIIMNARGGYGSIRLINKINYDLIKSNYKPFVGYSDITALLLMIYKKTGLVTYHGPMGVVNGNAKQWLEDALDGKNLIFEGDVIYKSGDAEGIIWGGNLATVVSLCGIDFIPDKDFIFFAEDINEPVYKLDRMFTQLFNIEKFRKNCKGIVLGDFLGADNEIWLKDLFKSFSVPTAGGFKISHEGDQITLPIGRPSKLSGTTLVID